MQPTELPYRSFKVLQLVAAHLRAITAGTVADAHEYVCDAIKRKHSDCFTAGVQHLLMLASEVRGGSRGDSRQQTATQGRCKGAQPTYALGLPACMCADATEPDVVRSRTAILMVEDHGDRTLAAGQTAPIAAFPTVTTGAWSAALTAVAYQWSTAPRLRSSRRSTHRR